MMGDLIGFLVAYLFMGWLASFPGVALFGVVYAGMHLAGRGPQAVRR